jgi:hypothetical protein
MNCMFFSATVEEISPSVSMRVFRMGFTLAWFVLVDLLFAVRSFARRNGNPPVINGRRK